MTLADKLAGIAAFFVLISLLLFVIFGQTTVRKLRKNPETRHKLGVELASGWDILNVAGALSRPKWLSDIVRDSPMGLFFADEVILYKHTNKFDRFLGRLFFYLVHVSLLSFLGIILLNWLGIID